METIFALIDSTTPQDAMTYASTEDGSAWQLVFSDEFNTDGRSFYPGGEGPFNSFLAISLIHYVDDPFWEAVDLHYWSVFL
jgi:beta-glucan synthesis-associated protein KRE6